MKAAADDEPVVFTVGHSTHPLPEFIRLLQTHGVTVVADIRTMPRSRHNPQFNRETLPEALKVAGLEYVHLPGLGGFRHPKANSPNTGWHSPAFQGFADYMLTGEFEINLEQLINLAKVRRVAIMCAEAVPWRCHRSLLADALSVRGVRVEHILGARSSQPHRLTPFARVAGTRLTYPEKAGERALPG